MGLNILPVASDEFFNHSSIPDISMPKMEERVLVVRGSDQSS
jgi:hypothetical protein